MEKKNHTTTTSSLSSRDNKYQHTYQQLHLCNIWLDETKDLCRQLHILSHLLRLFYFYFYFFELEKS